MRWGQKVWRLLKSGICSNYLTKTHASISNVFLSFLGFFDKNMCGYIKCFSEKLRLFDRIPKLIITISFLKKFDRPLDGYIVHLLLTYVL